MARHELGLGERAQPRGGARRRDGAGPGRSLPASGRPLGGARPCVRRGRRRQRERARHLRRRRRPGARLGVRRGRLRRARPSAPAADAVAPDAVQRLADVVLLRRGRPGEARLAGRPRRRRAGRGAARPAARAAPADDPRRRARRAARRPGARPVRGPLRLGPPDRRDPAGRSDAPRSRRVSRTASTWSGPAPARSPTAGATRSGCAAAATSTSRASSSATSAGWPPRRRERELLARALGAADRAEAAR